MDGFNVIRFCENRQTDRQEATLNAAFFVEREHIKPEFIAVIVESIEPHFYGPYRLDMY